MVKIHVKVHTCTSEFLSLRALSPISPKGFSVFQSHLSLLLPTPRLFILPRFPLQQLQVMLHIFLNFGSSLLPEAFLLAPTV